MLRTLFVFGILGIGVPLAIYSPFYALLLYLWYAMFRPEFFVWFDLAPYRLSLMLGILLLFRSAMSASFPNLTHPLSVGVLAFLGTALLSLISVVDATVAWTWLDYFARLVCVTLLAVTLVDTRKKLFLTVAVMATSFGFYSAKAGLASLLGGGVQFAAGLTGSFNDNNGYALGIAIILPYLLVMAQNAPRRMIRVGFYLAALLSAFTVVSLFSRGGLLALGTSAVMMAWFQRHRFRWLTAIATVVVLGYFLAPIPEGWFERVETIQTFREVEDRSALGRLHFWRIATQMAADRPTGVGLMNYEAAYNQYDRSLGEFGIDRAVHSSHFQVLAELGYPGIVVWFTLFAVAFVVVLRIRRRSNEPRLAPDDAKFILTMANAMAASMVGFLIGGAFLATALNDITWLTFGLVAALDRISLRLCAETAATPAAVPVPSRPGAFGPVAPAAAPHSALGVASRR